MPTKWDSPLFKRAYQRCAKRKERGKLSEDFDCLKYAEAIWQAEEHKRKQRLAKILKDPVARHLKRMLVEDREGELEAHKEEQLVTIDKVKLHIRDKKEQAVNLW